MGRWEPDAAGRLRIAALELFEERGFDATTVDEIARRAGLTKRTFFRHYADKREVLFSNPDQLRERVVRGVAGAPADASPFEAVAAGLREAAELLQGRREWARRRQAVIAATPRLQERELVKLAAVAAAVAATLRERGVDEPAASMSAESAIGAIKVGFDRWTAQDEERRTLDELLLEALDALRAVSAAR